MRLHGNAALSWSGRRRLAERVVVEGWTLTAAAEAAGVSMRCARKWVGRYRLAGERGLFDRSSRPRRVANRTPEERVRLIVAMRRLRFTGPEIAELLGMAVSTVSGILSRQGLGRLGRLGLEQPLRYERSRPGELVHIDVKRLGRIEGGAGKRALGGERRLRYNPTRTDREGRRRRHVGYEYVHVCVDDYSRLAYAEVLPDEQATTAIGFLGRAGLLLSAPRNPGRAALDRQRLRLRLGPARARLPRPRHPPQPHPPLPTPNQRQSRALHPHASCRLGLRRHLPLKPRTHPSP
jgi:transposase